MGNAERNAPSIAQPMLQAIHATNATNATDGRGQDSGKNPRVLNTPTPVDNPESSTPTTPTGIRIQGCSECGRTHSVIRRHCKTCGIASAFIDAAGQCLKHAEEVAS